MRAEVINFIKVLIEVTEDIFIKTADGIYGIREGHGNLEIRKNRKIVWDSSRQVLSIEDMQFILEWYEIASEDNTSEKEDSLYLKIKKAMEHRKELDINKGDENNG